MNRWFIFLLAATLISCKDFNLKKHSADEILQKELKSINWSEVDFYPTFEDCGVVTSKLESKTCFEAQIRETVRHRLSQQQIITTKKSPDTVILKLSITKEGEAQIKNIKVSEEISSQNPQLTDWLQDAISKLPEVYPAQKRGVPVPLDTQLPIILK